MSDLASARHRAELEETAASLGEFSPDEIGLWSDQRLKDYVAQGLGKESVSPDDVFRHAGYSDEEIAGMDEDFKKAVAEDIAGHGVTPPEPAEGTREAPVEAKTADDVRAAGATPVLLPQAPRDGDAEADFIELFKRRSPWWSRLKDILATVFAIVLCAGVVWAFFGAMFGRSTTITVQPNNPPVPGWEDLSSCSTLTSLDGSKELTLFELRQHAQFVDRTNGDNGRTVEGEWSYEGGKQYAVSIDGERTIYTLLSLGEAPTCMLIKGDIRAADLTASWFSFSDADLEPEGDY